jgi:hypothetical protein
MNSYGVVRASSATPAFHWKAAMPKRIDLTGRRFGRWTVVAYVQNQKWFCVCDCRERRAVNGRHLRGGVSNSCGCLRRKVNLTGKRFGRWTVVAYAQKRKWSCVCDCGAHADVYGTSLREGESKSCGCLRRESNKVRATKHGMSGSREYVSWRSMKERCFNPRHPAYENYGGRGIVPCEDWLPFIPFFADMGERPAGCTLDRIDPNGNYAPGNCRWADRKQQRQNQRPRRASATKRKRRQCAQPEPPPLDDPPF